MGFMNMPQRCCSCSKGNRVYRVIERIGVCAECYNSPVTMEGVKKHYQIKDNHRKKQPERKP